MKTKILDYRVVTDGLDFPEGPIAMPDGSVLVVEIMGQRLTRVSPDGAKQVVAQLGGGPNGAAIGPDGACYVCNNGGFNWTRHDDGYVRPIGRADDWASGSIQRVDLLTGAVVTLYSECDGIPLKGPNDIVFDGRGGMWFSDLGKVYGRLMDRGAVYYARCDGSLIREAVFPSISPNGVGLSPDDTMLYVAETETARLWAWPIVGEGELAKQPFPSPHGGVLVGNAPGYRRFDSLAVEQGGNICVATLVDGGITVFATDGEIIEFHTAPDRFCTNIAFGGTDMQTAWITLSGTGQLVKADWPRPGLPLLHQR